jgi:hypothetical protein
MRRAIALLVIVLAGGLLAQPTVASASAGRPALTVQETGNSRLCQRYQHLDVSDGDGPGYTIYNDMFGSSGQCLVNQGGGTNFRVTASDAFSRKAQPVGFPDIFYGCSRGTCSPGTALPRRVSALRDPQVSWYSTDRASGQWNAAFDIWFGRRRQVSGQPDGAELMIWLDERGAAVPTYDGGKYRREDGATWYLDHWRTCLDRTCWNYVRFWRVRRTTHVTRLALGPLIDAAERSGLIKRSWWLESIAAGYELWQHGAGLATTWFSASP